MQNKVYIIGGAAALLAVIIVVWLLFGRGTGSSTGTPEHRIPTDDPIDIALDFYTLWMGAVRSTSTDPYASGLAAEPVLSEELRVRLEESRDSGTDIDPVLCHAVMPESVRTKIVASDEYRAEVLILLRGENISRQPLVTLEAVEGEWKIADIECTEGESGPLREFSFEKEGFLLKSVPPPLDPQHWHLVFEEEGVMGHTAPLFFDEESTCIMPDGSEAVCDPNMFEDAKPARAAGEMTETGVEVKRLQLLE